MVNWLYEKLSTMFNNLPINNYVQYMDGIMM